jgi:large subunit ribosomal protein L17
LAPRFADRNGGYTRVLRLAKPRLGDAGIRAILEFVGTHDRQAVRTTKPSFETTPAPEQPVSPAPAPAAQPDESPSA